MQFVPGISKWTMLEMLVKRLQNLPLLSSDGIIMCLPAPAILPTWICSEHQELRRDVSIVLLHCLMQWVGSGEPPTLTVHLTWFKPILLQEAGHEQTCLMKLLKKGAGDSNTMLLDGFYGKGQIENKQGNILSSIII